MLNKVLVFSDLHLGLNKDNEFFYKVSLEIADWIVKEAKDRNINTILFCGDFFHNRKSITLETFATAVDFLSKLKKFSIYMITGNHDCFYKDSSRINSLMSYKEWPNIEVIDKPLYIDNGQRIGFIPWGTEISNIEQSDIMFGHFEIKGYQMNNTAVCKNGMTPGWLLKKAPLIFSGHFHKPQANDYKAGKIVYLGSPFQQDFGEINQDKFIYELDLKSGKYDYIKNEFSPKHVIVDENWINEDLIKNNIVKLMLTEYKKELVDLVNNTSAQCRIEYVDSSLSMISDNLKEYKTIKILDSIRDSVNALEETEERKTKIYNKMEFYYNSLVN